MRHVFIAGFLLAGICIATNAKSENKPKFYRRKRYAEYLEQQTLSAQQALAYNTPIVLPASEPTATSNFVFVNENKPYRQVRRADWQGRKQIQRRQNSAAVQRTVTEFYGYNDGPLGTVTLLNTIGDEGDPTITVQSTTPWPYSFLDPATTDLGPSTSTVFVTDISTPNSQSPSGVAQFLTPYPYISDISTTDYGGTTTTEDYTTRISPDAQTPTGTIRTIVGAPYTTRDFQVDEGAGLPASTGIVVTSAADGDPSGTGTVDHFTRASYQTATSFIDGRGTTSAAPATNTISAGTTLGQQGTVSVTSYLPYITSAVQVDFGPNADYTAVRTVYATDVPSSTGSVITTTAAGYIISTYYIDLSAAVPISLMGTTTSAGTVLGNSGTVTNTAAYPYVTLGSYTDLHNTASTTVTLSLVTAGEPGFEIKTGTLSGIYPDTYTTIATQSGSDPISFATTTAAEDGIHSPQSTGTINVVYPTGGQSDAVYSYGGCVADVNRDLLPLIGTISTPAPRNCVAQFAACESSAYIGQFAGNCYCGNVLPANLVAATCTRLCAGAGRFGPACGGGSANAGDSSNALSLYFKSAQ